MRLHPYEDGVVEMDKNVRIKTHDSGGNRLRDVVDPSTGFVTRVTSPLTVTAPVLEQSHVSGSPSANAPSYVRVGEHFIDADRLIRDDDRAPVGLVIRLTTDGDNPLKCTRVRIIQTEASESDKGKNVRKRASRRSGEDRELRALMRVMNIVGPLDKEVRFGLLRIIEMQRATLANRQAALSESA